MKIFYSINKLEKILIALFLMTLCGCVNKSKDIEGDKPNSSIIESYLEAAKDESKSLEERKLNLDKALAVYSTLNDDVYKRLKITQISLVYYSFKDYENYKMVSEKMLDLSISIKDSLGMAKSYTNLGIYYRNSKIDSAYYNFYKAEKLYSRLNKYPYDRGKVLISIAIILQNEKNFIESEAIAIKAIKQFELAGDKKYLSLCYTSLGIIAKHFDDYDKSIAYHQKAMIYSENTERIEKQTLISLNNIGIVYKDQKKYEKAKECYSKALLYKKYLKENPDRYARILDNYAYVNFLSNDLKDIPEIFYKTLKIRDSINDKSGIITNTLHLAEYYESVGNYNLASKYAKRAKSVSEEISSNDELLKSYQILAVVSDNKEGVKYLQSYIKLNDSLQREERMYRDKFARIRFETDEIVEKNVRISKENEALVFTVLGLTALFLFGYIIFRQQQRNKELLFAQEQQESNQEIYRLLLNQQVKLEEGRQLEQQRMSEELHDGVLGRLFGVRLSLDGINQRVNDGFTESRNKYIEELKSIEREIRLISHDLGTETLTPDVAYMEVVESLISDLCQAHKMEFDFKNDENIDWEVIDDQKKVNLLRILQESLQNIFKHAKAKNIKISFDYVDGKINLTILDDGIGFKSDKVKRGIGLKNITSRVSQMSGVVDFISNSESGTKVSVNVPI